MFQEHNEDEKGDLDTDPDTPNPSKGRAMGVLGDRQQCDRVIPSNKKNKVVHLSGISTPRSLPQNSVWRMEETKIVGKDLRNIQNRWTGIRNLLGSLEKGGVRKYRYKKELLVPWFSYRWQASLFHLVPLTITNRIAEGKLNGGAEVPQVGKFKFR